MHIIKSVDKVGNSGLARTGGSHKGYLLARLCIQTYVMKYHAAVVIPEIHMIKMHLSLKRHQCPVRFLPGKSSGTRNIFC